MISPPRDIFSAPMCSQAPKPPRAPVVDAASFDEIRELAGEQAARTRELFASVLLTAFNDAADPLDPQTATSQKRAEQRAARRWLDHGGKDFRMVCDWAGVNPDAVRERWLSGKITGLRQVERPIEIAALEYIRDNPGSNAADVHRGGVGHPLHRLQATVGDLGKRGLICRVKGKFNPNNITEAGIAHLQRAGGTPQREVGVLQGSGAEMRDGAVARKREGVK